MRVLKIFLIMTALTGGVVLLSGCTRTKKDEERIINWLNRTYGEDAYTMQRSPKSRYHWVITLKAYPDIPFDCSVYHDPLSMMSPYISTDFDEVFCEHAIAKFKQSCEMGADHLSYLSSIPFVYNTNASSLEELKAPYDRLNRFITFVKEKYPILVKIGLLGIRMDIKGIRLKGGPENDTWLYLDIAEMKKDSLIVKSYEDICQELAPRLKTHAANPKRLMFHADASKTFDLGNDTFDDCLYKNLTLTGTTAEQLQANILQPGQESGVYTLQSESKYEFVKIDLQAKNSGNSPCSVLEAPIVKAVVSGSSTINIDGVPIELKDDKRRAWTDPYKRLGISPPKTEREKKEGVKYKNIKVLFEKSQYYNDIISVMLTFQE